MRKKISIDQLIPGMYVVSTNRSWLQLPFFKKRIKDDRAVAKLREHHVTELVIDTEKGSDIPIEAESFPVDPFEYPEVINENLARSNHVHQQAIARTGEIMDAVRKGEDITPDAVNQPVNMMIDQILDDPQSMLCVSVLKNSDEFTFNHCVNVAILALFLGKSLNLSRRQLMVLGKGALLHDIGKCMVPQEILSKPGKLDKSEAEIIRTHVDRGVKYLSKMRDVPKEVMDFARDHHERLDGSGYPRGLVGEQIAWHGRVGAVLDVYDSLIHENYYKGSMDPSSVLEKMTEMGGKFYDEKAVKALVDCLGTYPPGTILMLDSSEIAIVFEPNYNNPHRPRVLLITREDGSFFEHPVPADLTETKEGTSVYKRTILTVMSLEEIAFDPFKILGNFSLQGTDIS